MSCRVTGTRKELEWSMNSVLPLQLLQGRQILGYLEKGIQNHMVQDRSTKIISMIK